MCDDIKNGFNEFFYNKGWEKLPDLPAPRMPDKNRPEFSQFACQHRRRQKAFQRRNLQVPPGIELPLHKNLQDDE